MNTSIVARFLATWFLIGISGTTLAASLASGPSTNFAPADITVAQPVQPAEDDPVALRQLLIDARTESQHAIDTHPVGATQDEVLEQTHLQDELVGALERHLDVLERLPEARQHLADQEAQTRSWTDFPFPPPYSILMVDQLRDALNSARLQIDAANTRASLADQQIDDYAKRMKDSEIVIRQSQERVIQAQTPEQHNREIWLNNLAHLRARAAAAVIAESRADKTLTGIGAAEKRSFAELVAKQLDVAQKTVRFTQSDMESVLANLDRQNTALEQRCNQLKGAGRQSHQALTQAQKLLATSKIEASRVGEAQADRARRIELLERTVTLRRLRADNDDLAYDMTRRIIEVNGWERTGWQYRWLLMNSFDRDKLREGFSKIDELIARLESWNQYIQGEILQAERRDDNVGSVSSDRALPEETAVASETLAAQQEHADILRSGEQAVGNLLRTLELWRQDFLSQKADRSAMAIASDWWSATRHTFSRIWTFELFTAEDNLEIDGRRVTAVRSVTVGKSLGVILLVLFGSILGGQALKGLKHLAVTHLRVPVSRADTLARWVHFVLSSMLVIVALTVANIPLTVFAFLGGALAIGIGFGTQVMLKNMISGIMLLVERPLRVGDIVEVGSVVGTVTHINIRSSTVRTSDGIEILVPNSTFIENNVTNWTYSTPQVRRSVTVGADYSAPPKKVSAVLLDVAARHPSVLKEPTPRVLLTDFGSDAMQFSLRYWIDYGSGADGSLIASELRFMIAEALTDAGISIPFPQRVIHLKTTTEPPV